MSDLILRKATPADAAVLLALVRSAYRGDESRAGWTTEADLLADERIDEAGLLAKIKEPQGAVLVGTDDAAGGQALACCELRRQSADTVYLGLLAVRPARQAGGLGRRVLDQAEAYARRTWGARRVEISVIWTRAELIAWYERRGFARTGEQKPFPYGELVNGIALRDDLYFDILAKPL